MLAIEETVQQGLLCNGELFMFTDNFLVESSYHKGSAPRKELFDLVLRLHKLQMDTLFLHVIHISGKQMCVQGTDGLSRGQLNEGMMHLGTLHQVPLHLSAFDREPSLKLWVQHWFADDPIILTPLEWFTFGHTNGSFIWSPPPTAADAALEQLAAAIHKRPYNTHLVIIPWLLTANWRRLLYKICDLVFTVLVGSNCWPTTHFEPLLVGLSFPLCLHSPWRLRGTPLLVNSLISIGGGDILRQLLSQTQQLGTLSESMVRKVLQGT